MEKYATNASNKFSTIQAVLDRSFDFKNTTITQQTVENMSRYLAKKNAKSK